MRRLTYFLSFCFLMLSLTLSAQESTPRLQLDQEIDAGLAVRLRHALHSQGVQIDSGAAVRLFAHLEYARSSQLEGMQSRTVFGFSLFLEARYPGEEQIVSTGLIALNGTGRSQADARQQAINQLLPTHPGLRQWARRYQEDYQRFFGDQCEQLLDAAAAYAREQAWQQALALVHGIPQGSPCYADAASKVDHYYSAYQVASCAEQLRLARLSLTQQQPKAAVDALALIDPRSPCSSEAEALLEEASRQLQGQEMAKAAFLRQVYQNQVQLETARQQIMEEVVKW